MERGGGLINFPPLKRGGLLERAGGLTEDLRCAPLPFPRGTYSKATS